jgi:hypothetical protein
VDATSVAHGACAGQGEGAKELTERRGIGKAKIAATWQVFIDDVLGWWPAASLSSPTARQGGRGGEERSPIEERPSLGGAHSEAGGGGGVSFETGELGRALVRYGALAWTVGQGRTILSGGRGKVAWGEGINEGGCSSGFSLAWRRERGMEGGGPVCGQNKEGAVRAVHGGARVGGPSR